jgi:hypothetical protein
MKHPGIRIHRIPLAGGAGLIVAAGMVVLILLAVPALRPIAAVSLAGGLLLALVLWAVRR